MVNCLEIADKGGTKKISLEVFIGWPNPKLANQLKKNNFFAHKKQKKQENLVRRFGAIRWLKKLEGRFVWYHNFIENRPTL